jgi:hypothetical protein
LKLLDKLFGKETQIFNWQEAKEPDILYPKHSFSLLKLKTLSGEIGTGWIDKAYKKYEYKQFCPYHIMLNIDLTDKVAESNPDLDMGTIEDFFSEELRNICVCHMISRLASDKGMEIELYVEQEFAINKFLTKTQEGESRQVTFNYEISYDPKWKKVNKLLSL